MKHHIPHCVLVKFFLNQINKKYFILYQKKNFPKNYLSISSLIQSKPLKDKQILLVGATYLPLNYHCYQDIMETYLDIY